MDVSLPQKSNRPNVLSLSCKPATHRDGDERRAACCRDVEWRCKRRDAVRNRCASRLGRRATIRRLVSSCEELGRQCLTALAR